MQHLVVTLRELPGQSVNTPELKAVLEQMTQEMGRNIRDREIREMREISMVPEVLWLPRAEEKGARRTRKQSFSRPQT